MNASKLMNYKIIQNECDKINLKVEGDPIIQIEPYFMIIVKENI